MPTVLNSDDRDLLIAEYERGPSLLSAAWESAPEAAAKWRPAPEKWSAHEIVVHCADSETHAASRIRLLAAEKEPLILGYDQDAWATVFDYHSQSTDRALRSVEAVRAGTVPILRHLSEASWAKIGRHTESGPYGALDWLRTYAVHLTNHARQIERNLEAFRSRADR